MSDNVTIYDYLAKNKVSETTITQLHNATKETAITPDNIDFWAGIITVARAIDESRTYGHALPIPELSAVKSLSVNDGEAGTIQPSGTEVWLVNSINFDNCTVYLTAAGGSGPSIQLGGDAANTVGPLYITNSMYLSFVNASGGTQTPGIAYHKVGL